MNKKIQTLKAKPKQNRKVAPKKPVKKNYSESDMGDMSHYDPNLKMTKK
jgi:cytochrome c553